MERHKPGHFATGPVYISEEGGAVRARAVESEGIWGGVRVCKTVATVTPTLI
jgi:hypothetical protein